MMVDPIQPTLDAPAGGSWVHPETANVLTHALGLVLSLIAGFYIMWTAAASADPFRIVGCALYVTSLVAVYAASTLSHSFEDPRRRAFYRMLDQICILLLVVGTYAPFGLVHARDGGWQLILIALATCAAVGILFRIRRPLQTLPIVFFLVMGWLPILTLGRAYDISHAPGLSLVLAGGLAYSGGTWFLANDLRHPYYHAIWHLCTIAGSGFHYLFLLQYVAILPA